MRTYDEYSRHRVARLKPEGRELLDAFNAVYALGSACARARQERGMTQCELAMCSGVAQAEISRIENCAIAPTTQTLLKLTTALNVRINFELLPKTSRRKTHPELVTVTNAAPTTRSRKVNRV